MNVALSNRENKVLLSIVNEGKAETLYGPACWQTGLDLLAVGMLQPKNDSLTSPGTAL